MGVSAPPLVVLDEDAMVLQCAGVRRPSVVVSRAACDALDDQELEGALAHEIAHLERRDPALGWILIGVRVLLWFNPVVQVVARGVTQELERRADERAAEATGDRVALAAALLKVFRATDGAYRAPRWPVPGLDAGGRAVTRFRTAALEVRCRRLLDPAARPVTPRGLADAQVLLAGAGMIALLFFVV
jgi:Zn-dependent protease with chaperone function